MMSERQALVRWHKPVVVVLLALISGSPGVAWSQIEEIVVTVRKRAENINEIPIAIQALPAQQIERQGIRNLADLSKNLTSLTLDEGFGKADVRVGIRGLTNTRGRSNIAYLVDGIDTTSVAITTSGSGLLSNSRLIDLERIEFVKGPQVALYGRSAFAGAIHYITKDPEEQFAASLFADVNEFDHYELRGAVGGPVTDTFGLRFNGYGWTDGGAFTNSGSGSHIDGGEGWGGALTGLWEPSDGFKLRARLAYSDDENEAAPRMSLAQSLIPMPQSALADPYYDSTTGDFCGFQAQAGCYQGFPVIDDQALFPNAAYTNSPFRFIDTSGSPCADPDQPGCDVFILSQTIEPPSLNLADPNGNPCAAVNDPNGPVPPNNPNMPACGSVSRSFPNFDPDPATGEDFLASTQETFRGSLGLEWGVGEGSINSWTAYIQSESTQAWDQDLTTYDLVEFLIKLETETDIFSQELRWSTPLNGLGDGAQLSLGGLFWYQDVQQHSTSMIVLCSPNLVPNNPGFSATPPLSGTVQDVFDSCDPSLTSDNWQNWYTWNTVTPPNQVQPDPPLGTGIGPQPVRPESDETTHWSLYGLFEVPVVPDVFSVVLEGRWVNEKEETVLNFTGCTIFAGGFPFFGGGDNRAFTICPDAINPFAGTPAAFDPVFEATVRTSFFSPKITLDYRPTDNSLIYGYWARSEKPGGVNLSPGGGAGVPDEASLIFEPEVMEVWEAGGKFTLFDGRLQTNVALFLQDFTDKQVNSQQFEPGVGLRSVSVNAAAAKVWGFELDGQWSPTDTLSLMYSYTFLDTEYEDYQRLGGGPDQIGQIGNCLPTKANPNAPMGRVSVCTLDLSGNELERAPNNAVSLIGDWKPPLFNTGMDFYFQLRGTFQSERWWDDINFVELDSYFVLDTQIGLIGDKWEALLYIDNVNDDDTVKSVGNTPDFINLGDPFIPGDGKTFALAPPRTVGVRATYRFGN